MKKIFTLVLAAAAVFNLAAELIRIDPKEKPIVILIPARANHGIRYAAEELRYHIGEATGVKPRISRSVKAPENSFVISLGETDFAKEHNISGAGMKHNHARVVGDNEKLIITGNDRGNNLGALLVETSGTLFAVYDILENSNGVRWLFPGKAGEIIPRSETFNFEGGDWISKTKLRFFFWRQQWGNMANWPNRKMASNYMHNETIWLVRHRSNRDLSEQHYPHGFEKWPAKYLQSNPEFFNLLPDGTRRSDPTYWGGQLHLISMCTSNQSFREQIVKDWIANFDPGKPRINLKANDTSWKCVCEACLADDESDIPSEERFTRAAAKFAKSERSWSKELGSTTERMIKFFKAVQEIADTMAPEKNARFSGLIYANASQPPKPGTHLGNRFQLCVCPPYMFPFPAEKVENYKNLWDGWYQTGCDLVMRPNFTLDGHCYPINYAREFYEIFSHAESRNLTGSDFDSLTGMFGANGLSLYTIARLQNSRPGALSFEDIENEYYSAFGDAAADVKRYFDRTAEISRQAAEQSQASGEEGGAWHSYYLIGHRLFTPEIFAELGQILQDAVASAAGDKKVLTRIDMLQTGLENARLTAVAARGFEKYKATGDFMDFANAIRELDKFREDNAGKFCFNIGYLNVRENSEWPRAAMKKLNANTKQLPLKWKFATDPANTGASRGFADLNFDDSSWQYLRTDKPWEEQGFDGYNGSGWYRIIVDVPASNTDQATVIIGAADEAAEVWINGKKLVDRPYPYKGNPNSYAESFEATWDPIPGKNVIAVKVIDNTGVGGITKPCYLKFEKRIDRNSNLVADPDFSMPESSSPWKLHNRNGISSYRRMFFDGKQSAMLAAQATNSTRRFLNKFGIHSQLVQTVYNLTPDQTYDLVVTYRTSDDFDGRMLVFCHADTQTSRKSEANIEINESGKRLRWTTVSHRFTARKNRATLYLNYAGNTGAVYFAEVLILPTTVKASQTAGNLVKNGNFAAQTKDWAFHRRIGMTKVNYTSSGDRNVVKFSAVKGDPAKRYLKKYSMHSLLYQKVTGLTPGKRYKLSVTYRTGDGFNGELLIFCHADTHTRGRSAGNIQIDGKPSDNWKTVSNDFVAGKDNASVYLNYAANAGTIAISEVVIVPAEPTPAPAADNLVKNGNFATQTKDWAFHRRIGVSKVDYAGDSGRQAVIFTALTKDPVKRYLRRYAIHSLLHQKIKGLTPGKRYKLSVTYRTGDGFNGELLIFCHADTHTRGRSAGNIQIDGKPSDNWQTISGTFVAGKTSADIYLNFAANAGILAIAEAAVTEE